MLYKELRHAIQGIEICEEKPMTLQCHNDRVIIRPDPEHAKSQIIIPERMQKFSDRGTVVAVGPGRRYLDGEIYPLSVKPGDRVLFSKLHRFEFEQDGVKYMVMGEEEILVVLAPDKEGTAFGTPTGLAATHGTPFSEGMANTTN